MRTSESVSLGLDSFVSPPKNNKSSSNLDTIASLSLSEINQNETLRLNTIHKLFNPELSPGQLSKISESNVLQSVEPQDRLEEMVLLQRWVHQAAQVYDLERLQWRQNEGKIRKMEHNNRLKKDAVQHLKAMGEYMQKKQKKYQKQIKDKRQSYQKRLLDEITQSKERTQTLIQDIKILEDVIFQQQRLSQQLQKELKNSHFPIPQKKHAPPQNQYFAHPPPHHYYHSQQFPYNPYQHYSPSGVWESETYPHLRKSTSLEQHPTPQFLSKMPSNSSAYAPSPSPSSQLLMQVLAANIQNIANEQNSMVGSGLESPVKVNNSLNKNQVQPQFNEKPQVKASRKLTISQHLENDDQTVVFSPTNILNTPQFDPSEESELRTYQDKAEKANRSAGKGRSAKYFSAANIEQSKVRIDVEDSISDMSKFSIEKRKRDQIRQSTIKIEMQQQDSKSGQTSLISDPTNQNTPRLRSPTVDPKNSSSFEKIFLEEVSCATSEIFNKPLPSPPKLPPNSLKKLRKVTEQQSDLFDSSGAPRIEKKEKQKQFKQDSEIVSVGDMVLDKSEIGFSERVLLNLENPEGRSDGKDLLVSKRKNSRKATEEEEDDEDFMQINLLAVSKISKEKQYSQAFKTISDDGNEIVDAKKSMIHKSHNMIRNSRLENIEENEQEQFLDTENQKREAQVKRIRKSSGSRFSEIKQPTRQLSMELN